jgi:hypothetical protein
MKRLTAIALCCIAAEAIAQSPNIAGTYTSYRVSEKSGDIVGAEVIIIHGIGSYFATIQCSEGAPGDPVLVTLDVQGSAIAFSLAEDNPTGCSEGPYKGLVTNQGLELTSLKTKRQRMLKRGQSFWVKGQ